MNPQAHNMQRVEMLNPVTISGKNFLSENRGETFSSHEIMDSMPELLQTGINTIAARYTRDQGPCSVPASYVGVAMSMESQRDPAVIKVPNRKGNRFRME